MEEISENKKNFLPPRKPAPCRVVEKNFEHYTPGRRPRYYSSVYDSSQFKLCFKTQMEDALPRDCEFAYMTPGYYATGFRILDVYKNEADFSEYRSLTFIVDPDQVKKWGHLKSRIPYPEGRITDLPGTRDSHFKNYCLRSLTPESAGSWRKSIQTEYLPHSEENKSNIISNCSK